eukprot:PITA_29842
MPLIHLGFPHAFITWTMSCITTLSFNVLINGSASHFFHVERELRQGCLLSPLLFLIVREGLSRLLDREKREGRLGGLKVNELCHLTHLLFVDDVLIFLDGNFRDSATFSFVLSLFSLATSMQANHGKSTITLALTSIQESCFAQQYFPYCILPLDHGFKYLGFWIKPLSQKIADWIWSRPLDQGGGRYQLPRELIQYLNQQEIKIIAHIANQENTTIFAQGWKSAHQLSIPPQWHQECQGYIISLIESHIRINEGPDELVWSLAENGLYTPKASYLRLISNRQPELVHAWWQSIWKLGSPPRTKLFFWCVLSNKVPTKDSLSYHTFQGPHWCALCKKSLETTEHIFLRCETLRSLWQTISCSIQLTSKWEGENICRAWEVRCNLHHGTKLLCLPLLIFWHTWLAQNQIIFEDATIR